MSRLHHLKVRVIDSHLIGFDIKAKTKCSSLIIIALNGYLTTVLFDDLFADGQSQSNTLDIEILRASKFAKLREEFHLVDLFDAFACVLDLNF